MSQEHTPRKKQEQIVKEKHDQILGILRETNIDCYLIFVRETSASPDPALDLLAVNELVGESAFIFFSKDQINLDKVAIVANYDAEAQEHANIWAKVISYTKNIEDRLQNYFDKINPSKIALNYSKDDYMADGLSHGLFLKLQDYLPKHKNKFVSSTPIVRLLRGRKTKTEIDLIKRACEETEDINRKITAQLKVGMRETDIYQLYHKEVQERGYGYAWDKNHNPAVDAGPEKEFGHVGPLDNHFTKPRQTLHNDFGIKRHGYCSDIQRMWFFGKKSEVPYELQKAFDTVKEAIIRAARYLKPGVTGESVDKIARDYVTSQGYEAYQHALGHQVGRNGHDGGILLGPPWPKYGDSVKGLVEEDNVFTLELYVKTEKYGWVSLEEDVVVTPDGCEFLVPRQEDFIYVDV